MPADSFLPFASHTFTVVIEAPSSGSALELLPLRSGFSEVILPESIVPIRDGEPQPEFSRLILRRAVSADQSLSAWMQRPAPRDCVVVLLNGDQPVVAWQAKAAIPERLSYSPLNAAEPAVLVETLELRVRDFGRVDLSGSASAVNETLRHVIQRMQHAPSE
jgi:hypothetical protein